MKQRKKKPHPMRDVFGEHIVFLADTIDPKTLGITPQLLDEVRDLASALNRKHGRQDMQRAIVQPQTFVVRLVLCMYLTSLTKALEVMDAAGAWA